MDLVARCDNGDDDDDNDDDDDEDDGEGVWGVEGGEGSGSDFLLLDRKQDMVGCGLWFVCEGVVLCLLVLLLVWITFDNAG